MEESEARGDAEPAAEPVATRDWSELPHDAIASVFAKLGAIDILMAGGLVCRSWLDAAMVPYLWRSLDMSGPNTVVVTEKWGPEYKDEVLRAIATKAVDRSSSQLEVFIGEYFVDDDLLKYLGEKSYYRAPSLKVLGLLSCFWIPSKGFVEAITKFLLLEELKLSDCGGICGRETYEAVGKACQNLRHFELDKDLCRSYSFAPDFVGYDFHDDEAHGIATMHGLRSLKTSGSHSMTNKELIAILDNCPHLESLDLHSCLNIVMDDAIRAKCAAIKISVSQNDYSSLTDSFVIADVFEDTGMTLTGNMPTLITLNLKIILTPTKTSFMINH